jgi:hypothetical protein
VCQLLSKQALLLLPEVEALAAEAASEVDSSTVEASMVVLTLAWP